MTKQETIAIAARVFDSAISPRKGVDFSPALRAACKLRRGAKLTARERIDLEAYANGRGWYPRDPRCLSMPDQVIGMCAILESNAQAWYDTLDTVAACNVEAPDVDLAKSVKLWTALDDCGIDPEWLTDVLLRVGVSRDAGGALVSGSGEAAIEMLERCKIDDSEACAKVAAVDLDKAINEVNEIGSSVLYDCVTFGSYVREVCDRADVEPYYLSQEQIEAIKGGWDNLHESEIDSLRGVHGDPMTPDKGRSCLNSLNQGDWSDPVFRYWRGLEDWADGYGYKRPSDIAGEVLGIVSK